MNLHGKINQCFLGLKILQYSIKTNIEGHAIRIFKLESNYKDFKKKIDRGF